MNGVYDMSEGWHYRLSYIITTKTNTSFVVYNGSGFDFHFFVESSLKKNVEIHISILNNGLILHLEWKKDGKRNKFFDLYKFIMSSLRR